MSDQIFLQQLHLEATIGVYSWEQSAPRPLILNVTLEHDLRAAGASDALVDTLNYAELATAIRTLALSKPYQLIEALAEAIAQLCLTEFAARSVDLSLEKPDAVPGAQVGVKISRP